MLNPSKANLPLSQTAQFFPFLKYLVCNHPVWQKMVAIVLPKENSIKSQEEGTYPYLYKVFARPGSCLCREACYQLACRAVRGPYTTTGHHQPNRKIHTYYIGGGQLGLYDQNIEL